jgi:hypothetical protein
MPTDNIILQPTSNSIYESDHNDYMVNVYVLKSSGSVIPKNINYIEKLKFIHMAKVNTIKGDYDNVSIVLFGKKDGTYIFPLLGCSNLIVIMIYTINNDHKFELVPIDIELFYNYNQEYALKLQTNSNYDIQLFWPFMEQKNIGYTKTYEPSIVHGITKNTDLNINIGITKRVNSITESEYFIQQIVRNDDNRIKIGCNYQPYGETIKQCKLICTNEQSANNCSDGECNMRCGGCKNTLCEWNITEIRKQTLKKPDSSMIKGFSGQNIIKITWVKPDSPFDILKYYLIVTNNDVNDPNFLQIHNIEDSRTLLDYYILDLNNGIIYNVFLISKNKYGISEKSNMISIIPKEDGDDFSIKKKNSFSNSLQNFYNMSEKEYQKKLTLFEKQVVYNDIKDILLNDLQFKEPKGVYNINIF